jgi:hypothetical protein
MDFFYKILQEHNLERHDGRALWKYNISELQYKELKAIIAKSRFNHLHPRDVILFYAHWWKFEYNGGRLSKSELYQSLPIEQALEFNDEDLYRLAKKGANILRVKWIRRQNTLYFRSLLLQGGLPLKHISENHGHYFKFLSAVLELQPESVEDFADKNEVTSILPFSSRNEVVFESCFEIVKAILNDDNSFDELFSTNETLAKINYGLKQKKNTLTRRTHLSKPKVYWLLKREGEDDASIYLHIGLADKYTKDALQNIIGFEPIEREYQLFIDDQLICSFRKLLNENYITDWFMRHQIKWKGDDVFPDVFILIAGDKYIIENFIPTMPSLNYPTLWTNFNANQWRLIKGNVTEDKEAALLYPSNLKIEADPELLIINEELYSWLLFEGEISLTQNEKEINFRSNTTSLNWSVIQHKPNWMLKCNMPIVRNSLTIFLYDKEGNRIHKNFRLTYRRHGSNELWRELISYLEIGCLDLKIESEGIVAYDTIFNIGDFEVEFRNQGLEKATIVTKNANGFYIKIYENDYLDISQNGTIYQLDVKTELNKIPASIKASIGHSGIKKLHFEIIAPFKGMRIIDSEGEIIPLNANLNLENLYGLRILGNSKNKCQISIKNELRTSVKITKNISALQPLITFKAEIKCLFYLDDAMNYQNRVKIELIDGNDKTSYYVSAFTYSLDVSDQLDYKVRLYKSEDTPDLFAIPLNCPADNINLIDLKRNGDYYKLPEVAFTQQFIVISSQESTQQLLPRYINTNENYSGISKEQRIEKYHQELTDSNFSSEIWKRLLAYFNICSQNEIPYSTFDELRAISQSSFVAARAFFFIGINQVDVNGFIQKAIPEIELDLGFCFHWIGRIDWKNAIDETIDLIGIDYGQNVSGLLSSYLQDIKLNDLFKFLSNGAINTLAISNQEINAMRSRLGERVINELPHLAPRNSVQNLLPVMENKNIRLLLQSPIAVAESIHEIDHAYPIWGGDETREKIRRNIQYCQYLDRDFYNRALLYALSKY